MKNLKSKFYIVFFAAILVMGIGYAALSVNLSVRGTAEISGEWDIYISNISEKTVNQATTVTAEVVGKTTANFDVQLEKPGSYAEYEVTVKNDGNLDAVLKAVNGIEEANEKAPTDIVYSIKNLDDQAPLLIGKELKFIVRVEFKSSATTLPTSNKQLTLWLDFEQSSGEITPPEEREKAISLIQSKNTAGNTEGLISDTTSDHNIRYVGSNSSVKNYVTFNDETWRIIGIIDGKIKMVADQSIGKMAWDSAAGQDWATSSLASYLNEDYYNGMSAGAKSMISSATYYVGAVANDPSANDALNEVYSSEKATTWNGKIGLITVSDYRIAAVNTQNWLIETFPNNDNTWFISPVKEVGTVHGVYISGGIATALKGSDGVSYRQANIHPCLYLDANTFIVGGDGSLSNPYQLGL